MNRGFLSFIVLAAVFLPVSAKELAKEILSKSGPLVLTQTDGAETVVYELSIPEQGGVDHVIWKRERPLVQTGRAPEGCRLVACDERNGTIAVMLRLNYFTMMLVQYVPATGKNQEHRINGGGFLGKIDQITGDFKVVAPDQFVLSKRNGSSETFFLRDGYIVDESGVRTDPPIGGSSRKSVLDPAELESGSAKLFVGSDPAAPVLETAVVPEKDNEGKKLWSAWSLLIIIMTGTCMLLLRTAINRRR